MTPSSAWDQLERGPVVVNAAQCVRSRHRRAQCTRCVAACPAEGALTLTNQPSVDADRCQGCGLCATACPTGALIARRPSDAALVRSLKDAALVQQWAAFACPPAAQNRPALPAGAALSVTCLGRLDASIWLSGIADGLQHIWLLEGPCATCPRGCDGRMAETIAAHVADANDLLAAVGLPGDVHLVADLPADVATQPAVKIPPVGAVSRRDFFGRLFRETRSLGVSALNDAIEEIAPSPTTPDQRFGLPVAVPDRLVRLQAALRRLDADDREEIVSVGPWARFGHTARCNGCQLCAFLCPTGALQKAEREDRVGVTFRAAACSACDLCAEVCPMKAATLSREIALRAILDDATEEFWMRGGKAQADHATRDILLRQIR